jgi:hypothetical protein
MIRVHRCDHGNIRHFRTVENIAPIDKARFLGNTELLLHSSSFGFYRLRNADDLIFFGHIPHQLGIASASVSCADDDNGKLLNAYISFFSSEYRA